MHSHGIAKAIGSGLLIALVALCLVQCNRPESASVLWPEREIKVSEKAANELQGRIRQTAENREAASAVITDEELTSYLRVYLAHPMLHEPTIVITPQGLHASASVGGRVQRRVRALSIIGADRGFLYIKTLHATVDGNPIPRLTLACVDQAANAILTDMEWPIQIEQVDLAEGSLVLRIAWRMRPAE